MSIAKTQKNLFSLVLTAVLILPVFHTYAQNKSNAVHDQPSIFPKGQKAPQANFTGTAWVYPLIDADSAFNIPVANVTFEAGAKSHWHMHGGGQALIAIDGIGYYQEKGKPIQILRKGDSVKCPPNTPHWHGASPKVGFTQIAVTPNAANGRVTWLQPVTDQEYTKTQ